MPRERQLERNASAAASAILETSLLISLSLRLAMCLRVPQLRLSIHNCGACRELLRSICGYAHVLAHASVAADSLSSTSLSESKNLWKSDFASDSLWFAQSFFSTTLGGAFHELNLLILYLSSKDAHTFAVGPLELHTFALRLTLSLTLTVGF